MSRAFNPDVVFRARKRLYLARELVNRRIWWPLEPLAHVNHPVPLVSAVIIFALLAGVGQLHEIYLVYLEPLYDQRFTHIALALAALSLLSSVLYLANYWLSDIQIEILWSEQYDVDQD